MDLNGIFLRDAVPSEVFPGDADLATLWRFLSYPVTDSMPIFEEFRGLSNGLEEHRSSVEGFLYVPGTREDKCLLVAHADTVRDHGWMRDAEDSLPYYEEGMFSNRNPASVLGADDRAGCAMLKCLQESGHSLLITSGEEHGQLGAKFFMEDEARSAILREHRFAIQLDRRNAGDLKCYAIPVPDAFIAWACEETGYTPIFDGSFTDICSLCREICGMNLSIGYYSEHRSGETLVASEWKHTLETLRRMLAKPLPSFQLKEAPDVWIG